MPEKYRKNYDVLGIRPGASWKELRSAYKNLVKIWHPDRFQQDTNQKKIAEERTKEINRSYKELSEHFKKHGELPTLKNDAIERPAEKTYAHQQNAQEKTKQEISPETPKGTYTPAPGSKRSKNFSRAILAITLVGSGLLAWHLIPERPLQDDEIQTSHATETQDTNSHAESTTRESSFTLGSTLGEVIAIQGIPTRTEKDVWHYGNSRVYFNNGSVIRWEESPDNPLKAQILPEALQLQTPHFTIGSTKAEVMRIQGTPERDSGNVWDYGVSRIYFEKDRVTKWYESPLNPLKVRH